MKHSLKKLCGAGALVLPLSVWAQSSGSFYNQAATTQPSASGSLTLFNQLQTQQEAINRLVGQIEELQHQLEQERQLGQQRYMDLDQRLTQLEGGEPQAGATQGSGASSGSDDPIAQAARGAAVATAGAGAAAGSSGGDQAEQSYQQAFALVQNRQFSEATSAFERFNQEYPDSNLKPNSLYWLGELYSAQSRLDDAADAFQSVIDDYPSSSKVADAIYKLGLVKARQGQGSESQRLLRQVVAEYPQSNAAKLAEDFLSRTSG
ncbi:tol-pal system protein YbgF [Halotalea alkalilenta]|uniref:tol-pal system protein YbgF n=1 Tax=Halotalea alkalilenta TaxID=376489 RepID=UPI0004851D6F|nr:tol-pal system protein YbgF [Halotalea alkalilenta]